MSVRQNDLRLEPMGKVLVVLGLLGAAIPGWSKSVPQAVEDRYNHLRSLKVEFEESVSYAGQQGTSKTRRQERGTLYLLRPGKMRWEYSDPAGKLFVSDGKMFYLYSPNSNQVQRIKPKQTDDLRAPLAFLLGKLDFQKEFGKITTRNTQEGIELTAQARSPQESYSQAVFTIDPQSYEIRRIRVDGQDGLVTEFVFSREALNISFPSSLFEFHAPPGAEVVEPGR
jgi:outer membrane lipoprotein carrier protein